MSKDMCHNIIFLETALIIITCGFIYNEVYKQKEVPSQDYNQTIVAEHKEQGYQIYQCPSGTIVIKFDEENDK